MTDTTVAIIGAGLAGLHAARLLHKAGVDFKLFEARDHVGGRILTVDEQGGLADDGFDLGPSWFWPQMHRVMGELIDELGLPFFQQHSTAVYFHAKVSRFFHREVSHLQVMFLSSCWRQDISLILPFSGGSG
jgi:monoamine oxidase